MTNIKINYDEDGDVLYVSFGRSEHVTGIELIENVLLRLDTGQTTGERPGAIGFTFINYDALMAQHQRQPLSIPLAHLRQLPEDLWQAVLAVITIPPVSDFLSVSLACQPHTPPLPALVPA